MANEKTENIELELTTDETTKFSDWHKIVNGKGTATDKSDWSNAQKIDAAIGDINTAVSSVTAAISSINTNIETISASVGTITTTLDNKQDKINDLEQIRSGAALGATALQSVPDTYALKTYVDEHHDSNKQDKIDAEHKLAATLVSDIPEQKVSDVKVNGTSVLENKEALIKLKFINGKSIVGDGTITIPEVAYTAGTGININGNTIAVDTTTIASQTWVGEQLVTVSAVARGTYNLITDLELTLDKASDDAAIIEKITGKVTTADWNDYVFVAIPESNATTNNIVSYRRYKHNKTGTWEFEFELKSGSTVKANSAGTPTVSLTSLEVNGTTYSIPANTPYSAGNGISIDDNKIAIDTTITATAQSVQAVADTVSDIIGGTIVVEKANYIYRVGDTPNYGYDEIHTIDNTVSEIILGSTIVPKASSVVGMIDDTTVSYTVGDINAAQNKIEEIQVNGVTIAPVNKVVNITVGSASYSAGDGIAITEDNTISVDPIQVVTASALNCSTPPTTISVTTPLSKIIVGSTEYTIPTNAITADALNGATPTTITATESLSRIVVDHTVYEVGTSFDGFYKYYIDDVEIQDDGTIKVTCDLGEDVGIIYDMFDNYQTFILYVADWEAEIPFRLLEYSYPQSSYIFEGKVVGDDGSTKTYLGSWSLVTESSRCIAIFEAAEIYDPAIDDETVRAIVAETILEDKIETLATKLGVNPSELN